MVGNNKLTWQPRNNEFYQKHCHHVILGLMGLVLFTMLMVYVVLYQLLNRPLPQFHAEQKDGKKMLLIPYKNPNLLPDTILKWAGKAATIAYTFDFVNYQQQAAAARPYFTSLGWQDYLRSVRPLLKNIVERQLFVNGVVAGAPVISNEGEMPGKGFVWRVQIPFLVTYQSANYSVNRNFMVSLSIVRVSTSVNKQSIGIDQFVMA